MIKTKDQGSVTHCSPSLVFFGTDDFSVLVLEELRRQGLIPRLVVTAEDRPRGRQLRILPPPAKVWAMAQEIEYCQPAKLNPSFQKYLEDRQPELFVVASYGQIIPAEILALPRSGALNIHPSLLPELRGPAPIQNTILYKDQAGVTLMLMDEQMDHGPIIAQETVTLANWPPRAAVLEAVLARRGAALLAETLPEWLAGRRVPEPQNHDQATYTSKITKKMAELDLQDHAEWNYRKFQAFHHWPRVYTYARKNDRRLRLVVTEAELQNGQFIIQKVVPEGKPEMPLPDFLRGGYTLPGYSAEKGV